MADITLTSGSNPADYPTTNGSDITILNSVTNKDDTAVATTLSCDSGLFTPASDFPMVIAASTEVTVHVGAGNKDYYYTDPTVTTRGTRTGRINV